MDRELGEVGIIKMKIGAENLKNVTLHDPTDVICFQQYSSYRGHQKRRVFQELLTKVI